MIRSVTVMSLCALVFGAGCDRRPDNVKAIMDGPHRTEMQAMLRDMADRCRAHEPTEDFFGGHALNDNASVANARISCLPPDFPMRTSYSLRPENGADTSGAYYYDKDRDDFFHDRALFPSQLSDEQGVVDLCVVSGTEGQPDEVTLCIAWRN